MVKTPPNHQTTTKGHSLQQINNGDNRRLDPFHLNLCACATEWRTRFAHSNPCVCPGTSTSENLASHADKMGGKGHCCVTAGRIKAKIPRSLCLFILQRISITNIILSNNAYDINIACLLLRTVKCAVKCALYNFESFIHGPFLFYCLFMLLFCCCCLFCFVLLVP